MRLRIFIALVFVAICVLALGRTIVEALRRPFDGSRPTRPIRPTPTFAAR
jgi:hypothetical protein